MYDSPLCNTKYWMQPCHDSEPQEKSNNGTRMHSIPGHLGGSDGGWLRFYLHLSSSERSIDKPINDKAWTAKKADKYI